MSLKKKIRNFINYKPYISIICGWVMTGNSQFYNQQYLKALLYFIPNFFFNQFGHLNQSLLYALTGDIVKSQTVLNYQWVLFYPGFFVISQWDGYRVAYETTHSTLPPISHKLPFEIAVFLSVIGICAGFKLSPGPIFLGIGGYLFGGIIGILIIKFCDNN